MFHLADLCQQDMGEVKSLTVAQTVCQRLCHRKISKQVVMTRTLRCKRAKHLSQAFTTDYLIERRPYRVVILKELVKEAVAKMQVHPWVWRRVNKIW